MLDGIFFINHALNVKQLSVFNNEERFAQTIETFKSIDKHCPNNLKIMFDNSPSAIEPSKIEKLVSWPNTQVLYLGNHPTVKFLSEQGLRSIAETFSFMLMMDWFKQHNLVSKRIYKLSGRYRLMKDFVLDDSSFKDAFVFSHSLDSWMSEQQQNMAGAKKLFRLRLWHMDYNLLETFQNTLPLILNDCKRYHIDVEHAYYKHLHNYKVIELPRIGVTGHIAPSGEYIDE